MTDQKDIFEQNLSNLIQNADLIPKMDDQTKEQMVAHLKEKLKDETAGRSSRVIRRVIMGVAAAAAIVIAVMLWPENIKSPTGGVVTTPAGIAQRQTLSDGTVIIPRGAVKYRVLGPRLIRLDSGQILLMVAKSDRPFIVQTDQAKAMAHGTTFTVSSSLKATFVAVGQGHVEVTNDRGKVNLRAGQQTYARKGEVPVRSAAPRFSHLVNWARQSLRGKTLFEPEDKHGTGEIEAIDPWGRRFQLEQRKYIVDVVIEDGVARTTVDQTFFNQAPWQIEGTFYFPLPPDASISRLAMYVQGTLNEGGMVERNYGKHVYESIVYRRRDPALLEMMEGNTFKMRIFPIFGRQEKRILISYTQQLSELYGQLRYWFPMEETDNKTGQLSYRIRIRDGAKAAQAMSSTHAISSRVEGRDLIIEYEAKDVTPDQDFLLHLSRKAEKEAEPQGPWGRSVTTCSQNGKTYIGIRCKPEIRGSVDSRPRQWIIINDVSASRSSVDIATQSHIIGRLLAEADDDDTFVVANLDTQIRWMNEKFIGVRSIRSEEVVKFASPKLQFGGTNMAAAMKAADRIARSAKVANPHVLYLGDGVATDDETRIAKLASILKDKAVFIGAGIGKKVDARLLQAMADGSGGMFTTINPSEDINWRIFDMIAALNTPRITGVRTTFLDANGKAMDIRGYPSSGTINDGEVLTVFAATEGALPVTMKIVGAAGSARFEKTYDLKGLGEDSEKIAKYLPRLWVTRRIDELLKKSGKEARDEIISLSKKYYVVTPYTSLLVLENEADYKKWKVEMGRSDHWQFYDAPKKIEVIKEPLRQGDKWYDYWYGWYGGKVKEATLAGKPGYPRTINETVSSVLFRVNVPFYSRQAWRHVNNERLTLHSIIDGKGSVSGGYGMVQSSVHSVRPIPLGEIESMETDGEFSLGFETNSVKESGWANDKSRRQALPIMGDDDWSLFNDGLGRPGLHLGDETLQSIITPDLKPGLDYEIFQSGKVLNLDLIMPEPVYRPRRVKGESAKGVTRHESSPSFSTSGLIRIPWTAAMNVDDSEDGLFGRAAQMKLKEDGHRIREFNRKHNPYGHWDEDRALDRIPAKMLTGIREEYKRALYRYSETIEGEEQPDGYIERRISPLVITEASQRRPGVPGTYAAIMMDRIESQRRRIKEMKSSRRRDAALKYLDDLTGIISKIAVAAESTGRFWSHQTWAYQPAQWDFLPPYCQLHSSSTQLRNLVGLAPALSSSWADVTDLVMAKKERRPLGNIDGDAAARIASSRKNMPTQRVSRIGDNGKAASMIIGANDRFAWSRKTSMYMREEFVCNGKNRYHIYPELGIIARRPAPDYRRAAIRSMVPHLLPAATDMTRYFDVTFVSAGNNRTTIRLQPIPTERIGPKSAKKPEEKKRPKVVGEITFDNRGRLIKTIWSIAGDQQSYTTYTYIDGKVNVVSEHRGIKEPVRYSYRCEKMTETSSPFDVKFDSMVVIDMPLRQPAHYSALLKDAGTEKDKRLLRTSLRHHLALANIQEWSWQRPWGQIAEAYKPIIDELKERVSEGRRNVMLGESILILSSRMNLIKDINGPLHLPKTDFEKATINYSVSDLEAIAKNNRNTMVGHISAFRRTMYGNGRREAKRRFIADYPKSPLLFAVAHSGGTRDIWMELAQQPGYELIGLYMAAKRGPSEEVAVAFEENHKKMTDRGDYVPISKYIVKCLEMKPDRFQRVLDRSLAAATKAKSVTALLHMAELAWINGKKDISAKAMASAEKLVLPDSPMTWMLTKSQSLWAMGRNTEALNVYDEIMSTMKAKRIEPSPSILAAAARLAQQCGKIERAVTLELQALKAESPILPKKINVNLFRTRYQWLWSQLIARVKSRASKPNKSGLDEAIADSVEIWKTWKEIDTAMGTAMYQKLAEMYRMAGDDANMWRVISSVIDQKPKDGSSWNQVAQFYRSKNPEKTMLLYSKAVEVEPTHGQWIWNQAEFLRQQGRKVEARKVYEKIRDTKWQPRFQHLVARAKNRLRAL